MGQTNIRMVKFGIHFSSSVITYYCRVEGLK